MKQKLDISSKEEFVKSVRIL